MLTTGTPRYGINPQNDKARIALIKESFYALIHTIRTLRGIPMFALIDIAPLYSDGKI
jgi:hypothetical protein